MGKTNQDIDPNQLSGIANVKTTEDNHGKFSGTHFIPVSGTINPQGAWYQSGLANVPNSQITFVINSEYTTPPNQNISSFQIAASGIANVPRGESSITH